MLVPVVIGILYLASAALFWHVNATTLAAVAVVLSPAPALLTLYIKRLAAALLATAYLEKQAKAGLSQEEALEALKNRTDADELELDTHSVAQWPFTAMLAVSVGSLVSLGAAIMMN
jgi:flagellar biosynthesis component FlhA